MIEDDTLRAILRVMWDEDVDPEGIEVSVLGEINDNAERYVIIGEPVAWSDSGITTLWQDSALDTWVVIENHTDPDYVDLLPSLTAIHAHSKIKYEAWRDRI